MFIPTLLLKKLYTLGSLTNVERGVRFGIKNRLSNAEITGVLSVVVDGSPVRLEDVAVHLPDGRIAPASGVSPEAPITFPLGMLLTLVAARPPVGPGKHTIELSVKTKPFGKLSFDVEDTIQEGSQTLVRIPRDGEDDYSDKAIRARQAFVTEQTGARLDHVTKHSFDPHLTKGNCEHFIGVAQVPLGLAGPITILGEHAKGDFLVPMATSEGTLVASYNRGIKVVNLSGGARCTVVGDAMQRAPVFVFDDARAGREFVAWVAEFLPKIREEAEATSSVAKLQYIDPYQANKFVFLRFNYSTGDAAGQNMVGRATFAACSWILDNFAGIKHFYLESNFATDKKASQINIMRTRGKRVTAEVTVPRDVLIQQMRVEPESLVYHHGVANVGAFISGANNNGAHSANGITAMFIATGQDVANVAESSAAILYAELTPNRDMYLSITIPSLIIATHGGGTGLPTQSECLEMLGCKGRGKVNQLAEIIAGVVLAGEISLASAISSSDWVSSHERYGRNR
jgi:hydroxymethylglutaryl-CoA reductase (NADPH)